MIVITGGAGFIGSVLLWKLSQLGVDKILIVDELEESSKWNNLVKRTFIDYIHKDKFLDRLHGGDFPRVESIFHMGANSSTTERNVDDLMVNNSHYSASLFSYCAEKGIPFIYASSAATYGNGEFGFSDAEPNAIYRPTNPYGFSKELFDRWAFKQTRRPPSWQGLKFFNVYGPNEYHKGEQASLVFKAFHQIRSEAKVRLFKSYHPNYADGGQLRDFIYVKDVVDIMIHFMQKGTACPSGVYNAGTGRAQSFLELAQAAFVALGKEPVIEYIEMPSSIRGQYQYFTQADLTKLRQVGSYKKEMMDVNAGVGDYIRKHLRLDDPYL